MNTKLHYISTDTGQSNRNVTYQVAKIMTDIMHPYFDFYCSEDVIFYTVVMFVVIYVRNVLLQSVITLNADILAK